MKKKGFTLIELLVVIAIIAMLLAILMPALGKVKRLAERLVCGTNLKGLGTAQNTYAFDYDDEFAVQGGKSGRSWSDTTGQWQIPELNWNISDPGSTMTIGSSLYLLIREADVDPKSFVCKGGGEQAFEGENPDGHDLVDLWDFGSANWQGRGVRNCLSYSYQQPYGWGGYPAQPASGSSTASMPIMADKNPWFDAKSLQVGTPTVDDWQGRVALLTIDTANTDGIKTNPKWMVQVGNSAAHSREGQNVLFGDGHVEWTKVSYVGIESDNIYTNWDGGAPGAVDKTIKTNLTRGEIGGGVGGKGLPRSSTDAVLANDDYR